MKVAAAHCNPKIKPALAHNDRTDSRSPNITPELTHLNEYTASAKEVRANIDKLYKQAEKNYYAYCEKKNGLAKSGKPKGLQNFTKKEKCHHEFIFEIAESTTMQQCQELADKIAELTGFKPLQLAIHRDEVFQDSKGKETHHYHAHAVFFTLDDNGLQLARREASLNKANLSKIQTLASECLKMPRGEQRYLSGKPQPAYIQDYKIYKAIKEQNKRDFAIIDAKERQLNEKTQEISKIFKDKEKEILDKEKKITSKSNELKNLEYDLNEQKRTLNQSFEKTLTELHLKQENRKKGLKNAFLNVISFGYYFKKIDSDTKKQENALLNTLQNAREEASITYKELEKANTGLLETKKRLENELTQEKYKHEDTKKRLEIAIQKGENQQNKAKELLNPTDYAKLYPTNAQNTHLRDKRQGIGR